MIASFQILSNSSVCVLTAKLINQQNKEVDGVAN
jgi:hypothetical protein